MKWRLFHILVIVFVWFCDIFLYFWQIYIFQFIKMSIKLILFTWWFWVYYERFFVQGPFGRELMGLSKIFLIWVDSWVFVNIKSSGNLLLIVLNSSIFSTWFGIDMNLLTRIRIIWEWYIFLGLFLVDCIDKLIIVFVEL